MVEVALVPIAISYLGDVDRHCALSAQGLDFRGPAVGQKVIIEIGLIVVGVVGHEGDGKGRQ